MSAYSEQGYVLFTTIQDLFIYLFYLSFFNQTSIPDPQFWILNHWSFVSFVLYSSTEVSNQHFQAIELVDQPLPEKLNMGFLFYGHEVLQVVCVTFKYKATCNFLNINYICDT